MSAPIHVTRPFMPPLDEFIPMLQEIWDNQILTNGGPYHQRFEAALCEYLNIDHISLFCNGTIALISALQGLRITGEVITTPYSFVATAHALLWNGLTPVFVDIDPVTCNLDPEKIEQAITPRTTAILPVHCYGNPCEVDRIQQAADLYNLKVIYDAAHAFGVQWRGESLLRHGDLSVLSFHATKIFHTFEGGAIVSPDRKTKQRIDHLKNFGFVDEVTVVANGINGKMSEFNAAFGMLHLKHLDAALSSRRSITNRYREQLADVPGIRLLPIMPETRLNYGHFPILVEADYPITRDALNATLREHQIFSRRYFYPLISNMPMYRTLPSANPANLSIANAIAGSVLCLPNYPTLLPEEQEQVIDLIRNPR
ncbi:MAG: DegT/DnrJ/EryC1/StrS family aminotransferase [Magnetococcus sp. YQC-9]